jgi:hypothetical protein
MLFMGEPVDGRFATYASLTAMAEVEADLESIYLGLVGLSNLLMVVTPLLVWLRKQDRCKWCLGMMVLGTFLVGSVFFYLAGWRGSLLIGYYVWLVSFCVVTIGLFKIQPTSDRV